MPKPDPPAAAPQSAGLTREGWLEAALEAVTDGFYALDREWRFVVFNRAAEAYFGVPRDEVLGRVLWELFPQGLGTAFERSCRRAMDEQATVYLEAPSLMRPDRTVELRLGPMPDGGVAVSLTDVTDRRAAEAALNAERDRRTAILESISDAFYAVDGEWRFTYVNRVAEAWWGRSRDELIGKVYWEEFPQAVGSPPHQAHLTAAAERRVVRLESVSPIIGRWVDISIFPTAEGLAVYFRDISERKQAEARQRLLVNELNHRVKNTLAVVQALARQTLGSSDTLAEAEEGFTARLIALSEAHDVLTEENWVGAELGEVIRRSVGRHLDAPGRLKFAGPPVTAPPKMALSLSLALHELATNALKYGALSNGAGEVELSWRVEGAGEDERLRMLWKERGGPAVTPPQRRGFGSRLIERALARELGGSVRVDYAPQGLTCEIEAPLKAEAPQLLGPA